MNLVNAFGTFALQTYIKSTNAMRWYAHNNPGVLLVLLGVVMMAAPLDVSAQSVKSVAEGLDGTIKSIVKFIMNIAVVVGVGAILYGTKLIIDKSNDRENVKNGHIVVSFVGGALMCMLWFVVTVLTGTLSEDGGATTGIGEGGTW